jgi:hypothetical protein
MCVSERFILNTYTHTPHCTAQFGKSQLVNEMVEAEVPLFALPAAFNLDPYTSFPVYDACFNETLGMGVCVGVHLQHVCM